MTEAEDMILYWAVTARCRGQVEGSSRRFVRGPIAAQVKDDGSWGRVVAETMREALGLSGCVSLGKVPSLSAPVFS